jgi:hypothetical protein
MKEAIEKEIKNACKVLGIDIWERDKYGDE